MLPQFLSTPQQRRIWGWYFFDWASQPYNTLLLTFVFAPYMTTLLGDGSMAQEVWGYGIGFAGLLIAIAAPILGNIADRSGGRMGFILLFSLLYILGSFGLWWAEPGNFNLIFVMFCFAIGLMGMEFATIFTNAMLPSLGSGPELGRISGTGWAFGYLGGLVSLVIMLLLLAENTSGVTMLGIAPLFGLDPALREGTRAVGPLTAIWYAVFMIPFFLWVREPKNPAAIPMRAAARSAWPELKASLKRLPAQRSLSAYLLSSMFYRDALNGMYVFGGIYAAGVLGWDIQNIGIFGILAVITGAIFAWAGGHADARFGAKPVVVVTVLVLTLVATALAYISREQLFGIAIAPESILPDVAFYICGALIGAAGGALQAASRTMMVEQADPARITEAFGLYALAGKATSFIAPLAIGIATSLSGNQQAGITPLIGLFLIGLVLLFFVKTPTERSAP